jgi:hypothetical protein
VGGVTVLWRTSRRDRQLLDRGQLLEKLDSSLAASRELGGWGWAAFYAAAEPLPPPLVFSLGAPGGPRNDPPRPRTARVGPIRPEALRSSPAVLGDAGREAP